MDVLSPARRVLALALALFLTACPKSSSHVRPDDGSGDPSGGTSSGRPRVEAKKDPAADAALAQAVEAAAREQDPKRAAESYLVVRKTYPETTASQEALYRAGVLFYEAEDYVNARKSFNELLFENPIYPQAQEVKQKLARSALEVGAYRDAYQTLSSLAERAEGAERLKLLEDASRAAQGAGLYSSALTIEVELAEEAKTPEAQAAAAKRLEQVVEGRADFVDIARVAEGLSPRHPAWPILTFKLARIYYHLRDWTRLEETLNRFLQEAPTSAFAPQAKELLARATRRVEVRPRTVGVLLPMTGRFKPIGEAVLRGVQLALNGSDIELIVKDTQGEVNLAGQGVEQLAFDEGAIAVLGPLVPDEARRAALVSEELQIPLLTMARQEGITGIGPYIFRNMLTNSAQAEAIAEYALNVRGIKRFALLYPNLSYGVELANTFWDEVLKRGGVVRGAETYSHDQTTFTNEAKKLVGRYYLEDRADYIEGVREVNSQEQDAFRRRKAMEKMKSGVEPVVDFDGIFIPDDWKRVSLVGPALAVEDIITNACDPRDLERIRKTTGKRDLKTVTLFGTNLWNSPKGQSGLPELVERGGKFVTCSVFVDGFFIDSQRPATRKFVQAFRTAYKAETGRDPGLLEAIGYDSALMVRQIIEKGRPATRGAMRDALANLKDFEGATGRTSFNDQREAIKPLFLLSVDSKGVKEITPEATGGTGGSGS
ncbi:penicillin-binding protein activator [Stigmatella hybrida]|uniref:penicillin-binding protein activator n=1 Tax=Stigmatella hybrida TaxID=394097 RepID=UPI001CDB2598|nr:penicillin-binding protein activator [Stigmatella hybrida]